MIVERFEQFCGKFRSIIPRHATMLDQEIDKPNLVFAPAWRTLIKKSLFAGFKKIFSLFHLSQGTAQLGKGSFTILANHFMQAAIEQRHLHVVKVSEESLSSLNLLLKIPKAAIYFCRKLCHHNRFVSKIHDPIIHFRR